MKLPAPLLKTWADLQLNFDALVKAIGGRTTRGGIVVLTWPGLSQQSDAPSVDHGLNVVPTDIQLTPRGGLSAGAFVIAVPVVVAGATASSFVVTAKTHDESVPVAATTATIYWTAAG